MSSSSHNSLPTQRSRFVKRKACIVNWGGRSDEDPTLASPQLGQTRGINIPSPIHKKCVSAPPKRMRTADVSPQSAIAVVCNQDRDEHSTIPLRGAPLISNETDHPVYPAAGLLFKPQMMCQSPNYSCVGDFLVPKEYASLYKRRLAAESVKVQELIDRLRARSEALGKRLKLRPKENYPVLEGLL